MFVRKKRADRQIESCVPRDSYRVLLDYLLALLRSYRFRSPFGGVLTENLACGVKLFAHKDFLLKID